MTCILLSRVYTNTRIDSFSSAPKEELEYHLITDDTWLDDVAMVNGGEMYEDKVLLEHQKMKKQIQKEMKRGKDDNGNKSKTSPKLRKPQKPEYRLDKPTTEPQISSAMLTSSVTRSPALRLKNPISLQPEHHSEFDIQPDGANDNDIEALTPIPLSPEHHSEFVIQPDGADDNDIEALTLIHIQQLSELHYKISIQQNDTEDFEERISSPIAEPKGIPNIESQIQPKIEQHEQELDETLTYKDFQNDESSSSESQWYEEEEEFDTSIVKTAMLDAMYGIDMPFAPFCDLVPEDQSDDGTEQEEDYMIPDEMREVSMNFPCGIDYPFDDWPPICSSIFEEKRNYFEEEEEFIEEESMVEKEEEEESPFPIGFA